MGEGDIASVIKNRFLNKISPVMLDKPTIKIINEVSFSN
jgi:hypothetical protein